MNKKMMLLGLAAVSAAMLVLPALASAGTPVLTPGGQNFTVTGTHAVLKTVGNRTVTCSGPGVTGSGTVNAAGTGGTISLKFSTCLSSGTHCTTAGHAGGTITATGTWSGVYLTHNKTTPGIKITGNSATEELAHFSCGFGLVTIKVEGSVIGDVELACNSAATTTIPVNFEATAHGVQKYTQNTATGVETKLTSYVNGTPEASSQEGTGKIHLEKASDINCV